MYGIQMHIEEAAKLGDVAGKVLRKSTCLVNWWQYARVEVVEVLLDLEDENTGCVGMNLDWHKHFQCLEAIVRGR